jgi:expansin (peptidoglycan-binding protein)
MMAEITHVGKGTWFQPGLGACGQTYTANDTIVAQAASFYDQNDGGNCGQWLQIVNTANGKSVSAFVGDKCPGCSYNDLDMSPCVFSQLADLSVGAIQISWHFMPK